ncbi:universal stress protein [Paracoccus nototheniae]|uniref:Universal stress protein n=1 Tax=Paracoccus nototheniae TaxID=2489002 RepID=A0ABW4DUH3_9RHOB|nr:universal stress protein [Paracoccus nototheniae]
MPDKVIALVDGSVYAIPVCEYAAWIAAPAGQPVELLHVLGRRGPPGAQDLSGTIRLGARSALLDELAVLDAQRARISHAEGRALLEDARSLTERSLSAFAGPDHAACLPVATRLEQGDLIDHATDRQADPALIVIGKRGAAADFAKGHLGSNLERVVRAAKVPVLVAARDFRPVHSALLAFDGGASAMKGVDFLAAHPAFQRLRVEVAMVGPVGHAASEDLDEAILRLRAAGCRADAVILHGNPETALIARIKDQNHDLLAMGAYGHSRIRRLIIGSVTTQMLIDSRRPVLLFR